MASRVFSTFKRCLRSQFVSEFTYYSFIIGSWVPAVIFFNNHVGQVTRINGSSMYPFLNGGYNEGLRKDLCWNNKMSPTKKGKLQRGMVVSFRSPYNPEVLSVKRVVALEGDLVYTRAPYPLPTVEIPPGHIWVEGDNEDGTKTLDSNHYGPISMNLIVGRITHILWPLNSYGPVRWAEFKGKAKVIKGQRDGTGQWI